jgi:hypothetical protein
MPKNKRKTSDYLQSARNNAAFVPSLAKYRRRKKLSRWEKAAITRASNKIAKAKRGSSLAPINKAQSKNLRDKSLIVGHGIRAIRLRTFDPKKDRVSIKAGELQHRRSGRVWHNKFTGTDIEKVAREIEKIFDRNKGRTVRLTALTGAGRLPATRATKKEALEFVISFMQQYSAIDPKFDEWFVGLTWSIDKPKKKRKQKASSRAKKKR